MRTRFKSLTKLAAGLALLGALLAGPQAAQPAAAERYFNMNANVGPVMWRDGSGRPYSAWVELGGPMQDGSVLPDRIVVARTSASGAADTAFGTNGVRSFTFSGPAPLGQCVGRKEPAAISFSATGELVVGT